MGILGFDLLKSPRVIIDLHNNQIKFNINLLNILDSVPAQELEETQNLHVNGTSQQNFSYSVTNTQINSPSQQNPLTVNTL